MLLKRTRPMNQGWAVEVGRMGSAAVTFDHDAVVEMGSPADDLKGQVGAHR